ETISNIVEEISDEVLAWQQRPLEAFYPVIYLDALIVKVRDGGHVRNKAAHIAVGVDMDGIKHVLGIWIQATEGAKFWAGVCAELANRGVRDVLIVCCDGLTGFPEAIEATWPDSMVQICVVHLIRNAMRFVGYGQRKAVAAALKPIYQGRDGGRRCQRARGVQGIGTGSSQSPRGGGVRGRLGAVHAVPGVPARGSAGDLHHQLDRVAELSASEGHEEPRPLPERSGRREAALAGDLQHRRQTRPRPSERTRPRPRRETQSRRTTRRGPSRHELEENPRTARDRVPRTHRALPLTTPRHCPLTHTT